MISLRQLFVTFTVIAIGTIAAFFIVKGKGDSKVATDASQQFEGSNVLPSIPPSNQPKPSETMEKLTPSLVQFEQGKEYFAVLGTTEGNITIKFDPEATPFTVSNFIFLANKGFYNGTIFHRVVKDFMIQGGDPNGDGTGGPGYSFADEIGPNNRNDAGTISMANSGPNTNGSQFFINLKDNNFLDTKHTVFGRVVEGLEVVDKIAEAPVTASQAGENSRPVSPVKVNKVDIEIR